MYNSPNTIKKYINDIHKGHGNYIMLHLSDNERFGIESKTLNQTTHNAKKVGNVYYNQKTHLAFLSKDQLKDLINYGKRKHVEVIPEIDLPGHAQAMLQLLSKVNPKLVKKVENSPQEMFYQRKATLSLSKQIIREYMSYLKHNDYFSIGADELAINGHDDDKAIMHYLNSMDTYINHHGLKMMAWNDSFRKYDLNRYHKNILINYWSLSGDVTDPGAYKDHVKNRATLPELNRDGFKTINCNSYFTYIVADPKNLTSQSYRYWRHELHNWNSKIWNEDHTKQLNNGKGHQNNIGVSLSFWGESPNPYSGSQFYKKSYPYVQYFFKRFKAY
ncbi:hypothetical protein WR164_09470 [Philodulcilactobacillus myokoensis]|uniref:Glycoside hydrolase family 20 catalytic domain-containing protein n=2 Tax=Philodulcilactobacillus myokoensis TaxID=2929573 RepID=A0A9W6B1K5_9LACO|nr:hypothetical protein WR164_09470 [Philodulcilactobacillus myokoensis]